MPLSDAILASLADGPRTAFEILKAVRVATRDVGMPFGRVYRTLRGLEDAGRVQSSWADAGGYTDGRRVYALVVPAEATA